MWSLRVTPRSRPRNAAMAVDSGSLGSFFDDLPDPRIRTRAESAGATSTTLSPATTSCWASRDPNPPAESIAQLRVEARRVHAATSFSGAIPPWDLRLCQSVRRLAHTERFKWESIGSRCGAANRFRPVGRAGARS